MELTSPGPSNEDMDKGTDAMQSAETLEAEELVESGTDESDTVPSTDKVTDEAVGLVKELPEQEVDPSEAEPEEDLVEEGELEPEPRKAHSEDLDSDERLSPGMFHVLRPFHTAKLPVPNTRR